MGFPRPIHIWFLFSPFPPVLPGKWWKEKEPSLPLPPTAGLPVLLLLSLPSSSLPQVWAWPCVLIMTFPALAWLPVLSLAVLEKICLRLSCLSLSQPFLHGSVSSSTVLSLSSQDRVTLGLGVNSSSDTSGIPSVPTVRTMENMMLLPGDIPIIPKVSIVFIIELGNLLQHHLMSHHLKLQPSQALPLPRSPSICWCMAGNPAFKMNGPWSTSRSSIF